MNAALFDIMHQKSGIVYQLKDHTQGFALAEPSGPWRPTFAPGRVENLLFFIQN